MARWIDKTDAEKRALDARLRPARAAAALAEAQADLASARKALEAQPGSLLRAGAVRRAEERLALVTAS